MANISLYSILARKRYKEEQENNAKELEKHNMMKLSEWLESKNSTQPAIFVDQDNTLLLLSNMKDIATRGKWANNNAHFANVMGYNVGIVLRPYAKEFLKECRKLAPTYILTAGDSFFQEQVLNTVGLLPLVDGVYGRDKLHEVPKRKNSILIDNLPHNHPNSVAKLEAMGGGMFAKVPDWEGLDLKDNFLLQLVPKLHSIYSSLVA